MSSHKKRRPPLLYEDLSLHFSPSASSDHYSISASSRIDNVQETFQLDGPHQGLPNPPHTLLADNLDGIDAPSAREHGIRLFGHVFKGNILRCYDTHRGATLYSHEDSSNLNGLRIRLHFDPRQPAQLAFNALPWELLHDPKDGDFLALDPRTPIVRSLDLPNRRPRRLGHPQPLQRILVATASPRTYPPLNIIEEHRNLQDAWRYQFDAELTFLENASLKSVNETLENRDFQIIHFIGHCTHSRESDESFLVFEKNDGAPDLVGGRRVAANLSRSSRPQLVFLNACHTGRSPDVDAIDPLAGISIALLREGIPAVLATQAAILQEGATEWSELVYRDLAEGRSLEEAVARGRLALRDLYPTGSDWAIPMIFSSSPDGRLFDLPEPRTPKAENYARDSLPPEATRIEIGEMREIAEPKTPKKLQLFQRDIYRFLDDLDFDPIQDYERLNAKEKALLQSELIRRLAGLEAPPEELIDLDLMTLRFQSKALFDDTKLQDATGRDELQRKAAIYSQHSIVNLNAVGLPECLDDIDLREDHLDRKAFPASSPPSTFGQEWENESDPESGHTKRQRAPHGLFD